MNKDINKKNKKILLLGLNGRAGIFHYSSNLSSYMALFADTTILIPSYSDDSIISKRVHKLKIDAPPNMLKTVLLTFNIFQHIRVIREMNRINSDIINILDIHPWFILYWPFLKATKKIVTIHDPQLHSGEAGKIVTWIIKFITRFLLRNADEIVVLGKKQEKILRNMGYKQKIIISKIGYLDFFTKKYHKHFVYEPKTVLFFGRIKEYKGLKYLLDAMLSLRSSNQFKLIIAGEGDISPYKKQLEQLGNRVELHIGYVSDDKVYEYFSRSSFTVIPYIDATQTAVAQVVYSFKKPIIVTNVGSLPEIIINGKTGFMVEPRNSKQLADCIKIMLNNPLKTKKMGMDGYEFLKTEFDWKIITHKLYYDMIR
jgi:glycosyltransferase involved in cell wall biosynthesis